MDIKLYFSLWWSGVLIPRLPMVTWEYTWSMDMCLSVQLAEIMSKWRLSALTGAVTSFTWKRCLVSHTYATNMPGVDTYILLEGSWSFIHADKKLQSACVLWFVITYPCFSCTCLLHRNNIIAISCNPSIPLHFGLVTPSGVWEIDQYRSGNGLLSDGRLQTFTWTNVDLSSVRSSDIHLREIWCYYLSKIKFKSPRNQWV